MRDIPGTPGRLGRFMWKFTFKGQNVRGTDGTDDGTDGTCPGHRRDKNQGVSRQILYVYWFLFLSPFFFWKKNLQGQGSGGPLALWVLLNFRQQAFCNVKPPQNLLANPKSSAEIWGGGYFPLPEHLFL